jgi:hypothetical protein
MVGFPLQHTSLPLATFAHSLTGLRESTHAAPIESSLQATQYSTMGPILSLPYGHCSTSSPLQRTVPGLHVRPHAAVEATTVKSAHTLKAR